MKAQSTARAATEIAGSDATIASLPSGSIFNAAVLVAALGYFVDIFDLLLFSIVRVPSLKSIAIPESAILTSGVLLHNMQMVGMLIGGVLWGVLADKRGRLSVLFGSILLYSVANIANAFVGSLETYAFWRFVAGLGLAGELGAGITLVSETLPKEKRGYGTMIVASIGVSGAVFAGLVGELFDWRTTYAIGGMLGLALLLLRIGVRESGIFERTRATSVARGNFWSLFTDFTRFRRYLRCILVGVPIWYTVGILMTFSPEFARSLGIAPEVTAGRALMACYSGLVLGDFLSGYLSQKLQSRKRALFFFLALTTASIGAYFALPQGSPSWLFYSVCGALGFASGYWAVFVTVAAEQFGTNLRGTVTTTVPNFVRGAVVPLTLAFLFTKDRWGLIIGAAAIGAITLALAFLAWFYMEETYGKDLRFEEEDC